MGFINLHNVGFLLYLQSVYYIGNGWNTVSRVLFRKRELTEFCEELGGLALAEELTELSPQNSARAKNSLSSVLETVLSETVFGLLPSLRGNS